MTVKLLHFLVHSKKGKYRIWRSDRRSNSLLATSLFLLKHTAMSIYPFGSHAFLRVHHRPSKVPWTNTLRLPSSLDQKQVVGGQRQARSLWGFGCSHYTGRKRLPAGLIVSVLPSTARDLKTGPTYVFLLMIFAPTWRTQKDFLPHKKANKQRNSLALGPEIRRCLDFLDFLLGKDRFETTKSLQG